jgi:threonine synthase
MTAADYKLRCIRCGREYAAGETDYVCLHCGIGGNLDVVYDLERIRATVARESLAACRDFSIWRYRFLLPLAENAPAASLHVGWTPLQECSELARRYGVGRLWIKDDGRNPTASLKDRASAVCVAKALERNAKVISCASTGNAASSLAGACANVGLRSVIFTPERAPLPKIAQLLLFGATLIRIRASYDVAYDLSLEASEKFGWYSRNSGFNPYLGEGKKTAALEICEQLDWQPPDFVFVPVGDGCILGGMWKGLCDLYQLSWIPQRSRMIGIQAEGASPVVKAFEENAPIVPCEASTLADGIAVGQPRDGEKALRAMRESGGLALRVSDEEIREALRRLPAATGIFAEPAAAAAFAGFVKMCEAGKLPADARIVLLITGNGLKDIDTAIRSVTIPPIMEPDLSQIAAAHGFSES